MRRCTRATLTILPVFLLTLSVLVYCFASLIPVYAQSGSAASEAKKQAPPPPDIHYGTDGLPAPVREMREAILEAVRSGRIEELRYAFELNELRPELDVKPVGDPVKHWKEVSADGEGREILAVLGELLDSGYVALPLGRDVENNKVYVWPYFAELPLAHLTPAQEVELLRLVPAAAAKAMRAKGRYTHWRLAIGADGTWHSFRREP